MEKQPPLVQPSLFLTANQGLFSNNYIEKHLPTSPAWSQHDAKLERIFAGVKDGHLVRILTVQTHQFLTQN
jgi:hypothetical protein